MKKTVKNRIKTIIVCAILAAVGFVLDRFLGITLPLFGSKSLSVNISFVPIFLAGFLYGPLWGMLVGGVQDLICVLLVPMGPFMPGITLTTMLVGALGGLFKLIFIKDISSFTDNRRPSARRLSAFSAISLLSVLCGAVLLFVPAASFSFADGTNVALSVNHALVQTEEYETVFKAVLDTFDPADTSALIYSGMKIYDFSFTVSLGYAAAVLLGMICLVFMLRNHRIAALLSAFGAFMIGGISAFTTTIYIPKALSGTDISVSTTIAPYVFTAMLFIVLFRVLTSYSPALTELSTFCLISSVISSVLNSFWISLAYTNVTFWVYLVPRLAVAVFIGVPLYTFLLWIIMKKAVPQLKKSNLL